MNTFEEILLLPGAAPILAAKLSGRIIGRVAAGFIDDPALGDMMNLFRCIELKWPQQTMSLRDMFDLQVRDADKEQLHLDLSGLTEEQRAVWEANRAHTTRVDRLMAALPKILDLYAEAEANSASWDDLTTINQWSLLNALERGLHDRLARYKSWADTDRERGRTESNAITLEADAEEAVEPVFDLITEFLDTPAVAEALAQDAANGINVPERRVA